MMSQQEETKELRGMRFYHRRDILVISEQNDDPTASLMAVALDHCIRRLRIQTLFVN